MAWWWLSVAFAGPEQFTDEETAPATPRSSQPAIGQMPAELIDRAASVADQPLADRMAAISEVLLGLPYVLDPLGEGTGLDADPFARYDAYDCLTYTEEVLSLSLAGDPVHAAAIRNDLRYGDGPRDYVHRRHFMELQWVPGVIRSGWLRNTTSSYGEIEVLHKEVTAATWAGWRARARFAHADDELPVGPMRLEVLPLEQAIVAADEIRPGSVLLTVRTNRPGVPIWITHVSFVIADGQGGTTMRHATKIGSGGTRDHGVRWYLEHLRSYTNWPVAGVTILEPTEQGPRVATVP